MTESDWLTLAAHALGWALGLWMGWMRWREPELVYTRVDRVVDSALGLKELPPIRLPEDVAEKLARDAEAQGLIVQAHARYILTVATQQTPNAQAQAGAEAAGRSDSPAAPC